MASQWTFDYFTGKTCHVTTYCSTTGLISNDLLDSQESYFMESWFKYD